MLIIKVLLAIILLGSSVVQASSLQILYQQALKNDAQYQAAKEAYKASQQLKGQARAELLPSINFNANYTDNSNEVSGNDTNASTFSAEDTQTRFYSFSVRQTLFDLRAFYAYKQVLSNISVSESQFRNQQQDIIFRTSERYLALLRAIDLYNTLVGEQEAIAEQLAQTKQRYEVGLTSITDVYDAQTSVDILQAQIVEAKGNITDQQQRLEAITNKKISSIAQIQDVPFSKPQPDEVNEWVELATQNSSTLSEAQHNLRAAKYNYKVKRAAHYPTLEFNWNWSNSDRDRQGGSFTMPQLGVVDTNSVSDNSTWNLQFHLPLYSGGRISSERRQAYYQQRQQEFNLEQAKRDLTQSVRSSFLQVNINDAQIAAYQQSIKSSQSALEATQAGYQSGTRNLVDVLLAQRNLYQAERNYSTARYNYLMSSLQLKYQSGILSATDLNQIDALLDKMNPIDLNQF